MQLLAVAILVHSRRRAERLKRSVDAVLTIEDSDQEPHDRLRFPSGPAPHHLVLRFEDLEEPVAPWPLATKEQVGEGLSFLEAHRESRVLVHCNAGISRSTAFALLELCRRLSDPDRAWATLIELRPQAVPNLHVLRLGGSLLGIGDALETVARQQASRDDWKRRETMRAIYRSGERRSGVYPR